MMKSDVGVGTVLFARKKRIALVALGAADFYTDVLYCDLSRNSDPRSVYFLASLFIICGHIVVGALVIARLVARFRMHLRAAVMKENSAAMAAVLMLSCTNLDVLACLPWTSEEFEGFPDRAFLRLTYVTVLVQNLPQLVLQAANTASNAAEVGVVTKVSLCFSALNIVLKALARLVVILARAIETEASTNAAAAAALRRHTFSTSNTVATKTPAAFAPQMSPPHPHPLQNHQHDNVELSSVLHRPSFIEERQDGDTKMIMAHNPLMTITPPC